MENEHSSKKDGQLGAAQDPSSTESVLHLWQEAERLDRFFAKLIGEVTFIGADQVCFTVDGEVLAGGIQKGGRPFKKLSLKAHWIEPMYRWLVAHACQLFRPSAVDGGDNPKPPIFAALRSDDAVVTFRVERQGTTGKTSAVTLSNFTSYPWGRALELIGALPYCKSSLDALFTGTCGTIVVAHGSLFKNDPHLFSEAIATVSALSGGTYLGGIESQAVREAACAVSGRATVVVSVFSDDPVAALLEMRSLGITSADMNLRGVLTPGFARKVCSGCAKASYVDQKILSLLPENFQKLNMERYVIGRGCELCGETGYSGAVGLQSVLTMTDDVRAAYDEGRSDIDIVGIAYSRGLKPLLEDGIRKALEGMTTFEAVTKVARTIPDAYAEYWKRGAEVLQSSEELRLSNTLSESHAGGAERKGSAWKGGDRPSVLVVEDDPDQRSILEMVLKGAEYTVDQASNGLEAIEQIERAIPDLIVCDLMMPKMDGSELVYHLKSDARFSRIPILMLTIVADEEKEYALLDLGADDYCDKTIQRKILLKRIEKLLTRNV